MEATTKDLRLHTRELLAAAERGEKVIITFRGKARAVLTAFEDTAERRSVRNPAFALWANAEHETALGVDEEVRAMRQPRDLG
jgi:prevent-host-death family protein